MGGQLALNSNIQSMARGVGCLMKGVLLEGRDDMNIKSCWVAPAEQNVSRSGKGVRHNPSSFSRRSEGS